MQTNIMGWDIGGAHLKAAIIRPPSEVLAVYQRPCQLWKGLDKLNEAAQGMLEDASLPIDCHVITMTGELVDLFEGRDDGVKRILDTMIKILPSDKLMIYAGKGGFLTAGEIKSSHYASIASANWLASATWTAQQVGNGLFVDIGSTTTDILLIQNNKVLAEGYSDYERLLTQELVYTGVIRTAVMAVAQTTIDQGKDIGLMAEYFATMADVYRMTGELDELHDQSETADGAEKTLPASARRLARMIGCDYHENELMRWQQLATNLRNQQINRIQNACECQMARIGSPHNYPMVGAGVGRFLVKQIATNLDCPYQDFSDLFITKQIQAGYKVADCAPAAAVACLAPVNQV